MNPVTHLAAASREAREPSDRPAAIFGIGLSLQILNLREWSWTIMDWLRLYEGLEQHLPAEHDPALATSRVFARFAQRRGERVIASDIVKEIEQQPFMHWHVQWVDVEGRPVGTSWQPLSEPPVPFSDFARHRPQGALELQAQRLAPMHVDSQAFRNWLIAGYLRFVLPRRSNPS